jgi:alkanesulfonate monooxygenase SsuD/methylene tetrahydromethanopterin reductase-like flavin-dependent oxidoreductase (luciferase family)
VERRDRRREERARARPRRPPRGAPALTDLAAHLGGHHRDLDETFALVRRAEALGYRAVYVDGDVSVVPSRGDAPVLDGWTATVAYLARSARIEIGSVRLLHHWNVARLAQAVATAESVAPHRLRLLVAIGAQPADRRFGLPQLPVAERVAWLDEWLGALRRLLAGDVVTLHGRRVELDRALVRPAPRGGQMPIELAAAGPRMLELVARHADRWDVNLPPVKRMVAEADARLRRACEAIGRDPARIGRSQWVFVRPGDADEASVRAAFRRWHPWFRSLADEALSEAVVSGPVGACRVRVAEIRGELGIDLPVLDLAGLPRDAAVEALDAMAGA